MAILLMKIKKKLKKNEKYENFIVYEKLSF